MRSDALFYELFQAAPQTLFELLQITPPCPYHFESITVKSAEKRIDGVLEPIIEGLRIYFIEIQAYLDKLIYWRSMREVATYFEQRPKLAENDWLIIVLFLDIADDPGFGTLAALGEGENPRIQVINLPDLLNHLDENALSLNVLRPLITKSEADVRQNVLTWAQNIRLAPGLDQQSSQRLVNALAQLITQKFTNLTYKEMSKMLRLTPLEETIDGKELIQNERIRVLMVLVRSKFSLSRGQAENVATSLGKLDMTALLILAEDILDMETIDELEEWIKDRLE